MATKPIPHGTVSGYKHWKCRCLPCADASVAYERRRVRRIGAGVWQPLVSPERALEHVEALKAQGMSYVQIAKACGLKWPNLERLLHPVGSRPQVKRIRPETEARILAARFDINAVPDRSLIPAQGTVRRVRALRAQGWPQLALAARCGVNQHTLSGIHGQQLVLARTARAVALAYEDLRDQDPTRYGVDVYIADRTRREARAANMAPPSAWTDIDLDDGPAPRRTWRVQYRRRQPQDRRDAVLEETAHLASFGLTREQIAERLGVTWEAVFRVHLRAGRPLPRPLRQEVAA